MSDEDKSVEPAAQATEAEEAPPEPGSPKWWEQSQPSWKQKLNSFCENWIFALIVAMAIRHFFLEAYRIPTASMEPMLYGDRAITRADHVLVDKFLFRFKGPSRWDVTVFQYPWPEVESRTPGQDTTYAINADGKRIDSTFSRPLLHRNFVKRCLVMPGDKFFIRWGDLYIEEDGKWQTAQKPDDLIERLWQLVYQHGAQDGYLPWEATGGSKVADDEGSLSLELTDGGAVTFTQPLRNLYVREDGMVGVKPRYGSGSMQQVTVSMHKPQFTFDTGGHQKTGNIWELDKWHVNRLTTADLDSKRHGSSLNKTMTEFVGDVRLSFDAINTGERLNVHFRQEAFADAPAQHYRLQLADGAWELFVADKSVAKGQQEGSGPWGLASMDDRLWVERDGKKLHDVVVIPATDPAQQKLQISFTGSGSVSLANVSVHRDLHYCSRGIIQNEAPDWEALRLQQRASNKAPAMISKLEQERAFLEADGNANKARLKQITDELNHLYAMQGQDPDSAKVQMRQLLRNRQAFVTCLVDDQLRQTLVGKLEKFVDEPTRRISDGDLDWLQPLGVSPETAIQAPDTGYLLLGDNSPFSFDGRNWAWVPETNLRGRVLYSVMLPFKRWQSVR